MPFPAHQVPAHIVGDNHHDIRARITLTRRLFNNTLKHTGIQRRLAAIPTVPTTIQTDRNAHTQKTNMKQFATHESGVDRLDPRDSASHYGAQ